MTLWEFLGNRASRKINDVIDNMEDEVGYRLTYYLRRAERRIKAAAVSFLFTMLSAVFFILAVSFFMTEYLALSNTVSYIIIAILLFTISLLMRLRY